MKCFSLALVIKAPAKVSQMNENIRIGIRMARPADAAEIANIYVESWRETYAGILPASGLLKMSKPDHTAIWTRAINASNLRNPTLVAADANANVYGFAGAGNSRDRSLPYEAEIYTLYVAPGFTGQGIGACLMSSMFRLFSKANCRGMIIWALADNPSRFFYEAMGGRLIAERLHPMWGATYREIAYGWTSLDLNNTAQRVGRTSQTDPSLE
jgi:L-amino acid N-acyltransferase YncA